MKINVRDYKNIWFTSDIHGFHKQEFLWKPRGCSSAEAHTRMIIDGINSLASEGDVIFHLGDLVLSCEYSDMLDMLIEIKCKTWHFIIGNHDTRIAKLLDRLKQYSKWDEMDERVKNEFNPPPVDLCDKEKCIYDNKSLINLGKFKELVIQEPSDEVGVKDLKYHVTLCHYPMILWNHSHHGSYCCVGHSHNSLNTTHFHNPNGKILDCGVDSALEYHQKVLFNWNDIKDIMSTKKIYKPDHHNEKTT